MVFEIAAMLALMLLGVAALSGPLMLLMSRPFSPVADRLVERALLAYAAAVGGGVTLLVTSGVPQVVAEFGVTLGVTLAFAALLTRDARRTVCGQGVLMPRLLDLGARWALARRERADKQLRDHKLAGIRYSIGDIRGEYAQQALAAAVGDPGLDRLINHLAAGVSAFLDSVEEQCPNPFGERHHAALHTRYRTLTIFANSYLDRLSDPGACPPQRIHPYFSEMAIMTAALCRLADAPQLRTG